MLLHHCPITCDEMEATQRYNPNPAWWGKPSPQGDSPIVSTNPQPHWNFDKHERTIGPTRFRCKDVSVSVEGRPFTRVEIAARHVVHHLFSSTTLQQRDALLALDQEAKSY